MALRPIQYEDGQMVKLPCATSQTIVKGDMLSNADATGYYTTVSAGDGIVPRHVAMETVTTAANGEMVLAIRVAGVVFEADTDDVVSLVDVGTLCDIASKSTLDPDASSDDIFFIESMVGTAEVSKKVIGWFTPEAPQT